MSQTLHSAAEILPQLLKDEGVLNGEGSIAFTKPDKTIARIFLRKGNIYAVDNLGYENNLWNELKFEKHITHTNLRALIRAHKSQRDSLYKLLKRTRNRLKNEESLVASLQEYILGAIDDIYSWESVKVEWRMGDSFSYDAANVPDFALSHLITLSANRSLYKFNKYKDWGFKDDYQFLYAKVRFETNPKEIKANSLIEETMLLSEHFVVKGFTDETGYSLFSIASALDDLNKRIKIVIENPSGRQQPKEIPSIPVGFPMVKDKVHFSATDEDPEMLKVFNSAYHVPEPALLEDDTNDENSDESDSSNANFRTFDEVINDTSSMEIINMELPPLLVEEKKASSNGNSRPTIPDDELRKELEANDDLAALYKTEVPKARGAVTKPIATVKRKVEKAEIETESVAVSEPKSAIETPEAVTDKLIETLSQELEGKEMSDMSLFALLEQVESQLSNQKSQIENRRRNISEKEVQLEAAKQEVNRLTLELANEIGAKESAIADHEKALKIIETLKN